MEERKNAPLVARDTDNGNGREKDPFVHSSFNYSFIILYTCIYYYFFIYCCSSYLQVQRKQKIIPSLPPIADYHRLHNSIKQVLEVITVYTEYYIRTSLILLEHLPEMRRFRVLGIRYTYTAHWYNHIYLSQEHLPASTDCSTFLSLSLSLLNLSL